MKLVLWVWLALVWAMEGSGMDDDVLAEYMAAYNGADTDEVAEFQPSDETAQPLPPPKPRQELSQKLPLATEAHPTNDVSHATDRLLFPLLLTAAVFALLRPVLFFP